MERELESVWEGLQIQLRLPDLWQQEAIRKLHSGADVVLSAPTGAGKTFVFENLIEEGKFLKKGEQAVYTVPTRALANDKWREWKKSGWDIGIATGDVAENVEAPILVATLETQRERMLQGHGPRLLIIDEYQMIGDRRRGLNYELAIALAPPPTQLLLMSGSVRNPRKVCDWLGRLDRQAEVVQTEERPVPLDEVPLEALPKSAPRKYKNYWQRLALGTLLSGLGPLLIFAPHRKSAEKIAWKIAEALPDDFPIEFSDHKLRHCCSPELSKLLRKRVAWHHSGMSFQERSAIVEPLAKTGQLRVVVATMGLAAGINFSVRSVFVSDTQYQDGPFQREVSPDELLQMFGRAGRRGLDETGYVICGRRSPRLMDARRLELRRCNDIDWPTLLRKMQLSHEEKGSPFEIARSLCERLFSQQHIVLGFDAERSARQPPASNEELEGSRPLFDLRPIRKEMLNSAGKWESHPGDRDSHRRFRLGDCLTFAKGSYRLADSVGSLMQEYLPKGSRLCRLRGIDSDSEEQTARRYGFEFAAATKLENGKYRVTRNLKRKVQGSLAKAEIDKEELCQFLPDLLEDRLGGGKFYDLVARGRTLYFQGTLSELQVQAIQDREGRALISPRTRSVEIRNKLSLKDRKSGAEFTPVKGSPAHAWRKLGLVNARGWPTTRGQIVSFFLHGEGLAVAAALEDESYPIEELIIHLANLRASHRFEAEDLQLDCDSTGSERLAATCRQTYGPVDYDGYLRLGLPTSYGEGAAEIIQLMFEGKLASVFTRARAQLDFGQGDVERAVVEWLSLLRQIVHAPDLPALKRWQELKKAATIELARRDRGSPLTNLPEIPATILQKPPQNFISYNRI